MAEGMTRISCLHEEERHAGVEPVVGGKRADSPAQAFSRLQIVGAPEAKRVRYQQAARGVKASKQAEINESGQGSHPSNPLLTRLMKWQRSQGRSVPALKGTCRPLSCSASCPAGAPETAKAVSSLLQANDGRNAAGPPWKNGSRLSSSPAGANWTATAVVKARGSPVVAYTTAAQPSIPQEKDTEGQ